MLNSLVIPLVVLGTQLFFKFLLDKEIAYIGISLAAISFGQIYPYISYDHFFTNKILVLKPVHKGIRNVSTRYVPTKIVENHNVDRYKSYTNFMVVIVFVLFLITTGLGLKGEECLHNIFGVSAVILSTIYQVWL